MVVDSVVTRVGRRGRGAARSSTSTSAHGRGHCDHAVPRPRHVVVTRRARREWLVSDIDASDDRLSAASDGKDRLVPDDDDRPADHRSRPHRSVRRLLRGVPRPAGRRRRLAARARRPDHRDVPGEGDPRRGRLPDREGPRPGRGPGGAGVDRPAGLLPRPDRARPSAPTATRSRSASTTAPRSTPGAVIITAGIGKFSPRPLPAGDGWLGRGHGVLRPVVPAVRRQGRRHRRRRRQRLRLGAAPRAGGAVGHARAPPRRVPRPRAHRRRGAATARSRSSPGRRSPPARRRRRSRRSRSPSTGRSRDVRPAQARRGRARLHRRPRRRCRSGGSRSRSGTSSSTPRCRPACSGSSRPATSRSTPARSG